MTKDTFERFSQNILRQLSPLTRHIASLNSIQTQSMDAGVKSLVQWTRTKSATIVFDSSVDAFTGEAFFAKVGQKKNVAAICFTTEGDVFGGCWSAPVRALDTQTPDPTIFLFSLETHGRCSVPRPFPAKKGTTQQPFVTVLGHFKNGFLRFGHGKARLCLGDECSSSFCEQLANGFEGLDEYLLVGRVGVRSNIHVTRLVALFLV